MSAPPRILNVLLFGCGGVGRQLLHHVISTREIHFAQGVKVAVLGVIDSRFFVTAKHGELSDSDMLQLCSAKENKSLLSDLDNVTVQPIGEDSTQTITSTIRYMVNSFGCLILVDCTASQDTAQIFADLSSSSCFTVLANKKPLTSSLDVYDKLVASPRRMRCESTVGAGLPVIASLTRILNSGDSITRILGALSGTLGFVMSELQEGKPFSTIVTSAKSLGYTEPDPRDDLSGLDVARKALIMARLMGWRLNMKDVKIESLYPEELAPVNMSLEDFLEKGLLELNTIMESRVQEASKRNCVLRYLATVEDHQCKVGLVEQPRDSTLGQLRGSDNLIEIYSRCYSGSPLVIQGAGAGNDTTAAGVLADILDLQDLFCKAH